MVHVHNLDRCAIADEFVRFVRSIKLVLIRTQLPTVRCPHDKVTEGLKNIT